MALASEIPSEMFIFCRLTCQSNRSGSTDFYKQVFLRYNDPVFQELPIEIINVSDSNGSYKQSTPTSDTFKKILSSHNIKLNEMHGFQTISNIENAVQDHVEKLVVQLTKSEIKLISIENEVNRLEKLIERKMKVKILKQQSDIEEDVDIQEISDN